MEQQANLLAPPHERRQALNDADVKPPSHLTLAENAPKPGATGHPFQVMLPEIHVRKSSARKSLSRLGDYQTIWRSRGLNSGCQIQGFAYCKSLPCATLADQFTDHDQPSRDADPNLASDSGTRINRGHGIDQAKPSTYSALGIVLVRLRIAEVGENAVAEILSD